MSSAQSSLMHPQHRSKRGSAGHSAPESRLIDVLHSRHDESCSFHMLMSKSTVFAVSAPNNSLQTTASSLAVRVHRVGGHSS